MDEIFPWLNYYLPKGFFGLSVEIIAHQKNMKELSV